MKFEPKEILNLEVVKEACRPKFFKVKTKDGQLFDIHKFKFQYGKPVPDSIICYVKQVKPNLILVQDLSVYIKNFYEVGKEYDFKVKAIKKDPSLQYVLEDDKGLLFNLPYTAISLAKGSVVKCRVIKIDGAKVTLKYVGTLTPRLPLVFLSLEEWSKTLREWANTNDLNVNPSYYHRLLGKIPEFEPVMQKYEHLDATWVLDILETAVACFPQWINSIKSRLENLDNPYVDKTKKSRVIIARLTRKLEVAVKVALTIIEESGYLRECNLEVRNTLQSKLSRFIELFEQYIMATKMILENKHIDFIDKMFVRLMESGYLYKPNRQIRIMMTILKLMPELINGKMLELFETLHNWEEINWKSEPFRSALVQQLQLFIEENYETANLRAVNDAGGDNKVIARLILALAVQRLLANDKDDIDVDLNRSILYRYDSYRNSDAVEVLLNKGISALLGVDMPNEYSWKDTNQPELLFNKLGSPLSETTVSSNVVKTYSTSKVEIQLREDNIHILAADADPESTVIPNSMFDWLSPVISLDDASEIKMVKKNSKSLRDYKTLWDQISFSIFGHNVSQAEPLIDKRKPLEDEEVKVIIDGYRYNPAVNEKQRLQFHCVIKDDVFEGEGWMPCDALHMVGWYADKDFDDSLRFAYDEKGNPLIFQALVSFSSDGELIFSMKEQIENMLLDTSFTGKESVAKIMAHDRNSCSFICLSETGASYKIPDDDPSIDLHIGSILRISYVEPDHSNFSSKYFIGNIAENQSDLPSSFSKTEALFNLMQNLGEVQTDYVEENDFEVVESQQIMSQEELVELIYILYRRALSEDEYVKAYNFLGLASLLAKAADEQKLIDEISLHMTLLEVLQDFEKNRKVDQELLDSFNGKIEHSPILHHLYTRLKIVADIDINKDDKFLLETKKQPRNETEGKLASLVLAYNFLPEDLEKPRKDIMNQITTLLNVNTSTIESKYYGVESQFVEFKSSMVFHAEGGKDHARRQLWEITQIIVGFMNSRDGKLYIGVNDAGYENGLDDDLAWRKKEGKKATLDAMIIDLQNHLDRVLPVHAKDHFHIYPDADSKKGVLVVDIYMVKQPVELDGVIYVRTSSSTKPRLGEERESFIKNRPHNYENFLRLRNADSPTDSYGYETVETEVSKNSQSDDITLKEGEQTIGGNKSDKEDKSDKILTGEHRSNVLHSWEDNFAEPAFYLNFKNNNTLTMTIGDRYADSDPDCRLCLVVKEREKTGKLVLTDSNERIKTIPLDLISKFDEDQPVKLGNSKLTNANIAIDSDYLLSVIKASNGGYFYRLDKVAALKEVDKLNEEGKQLCEGSHHIVRQEIIHSDRFNFFDKDAVDKDARSFGCSLPMGDGTLSIDERIDQLIAPAKRVD